MKHWKRYIFGILIIIMIAIGSIVSIGFTRYKTIIAELPLDQAVENLQSDVNYIHLDEVNDDFIQAIIAIEDPTFYDHSGVVLSNIIEAFFTNIVEKEFVMGGSTITQQLSKNIYLDQKKTFQRKVAELFFVYDLEKALSKDEILELYINIIYFGDGYYGINEASQGYFQKSPSELSISEATLLAGLPQAPAVYQLSDGMDLAKQRQHFVLEAMYAQNLISEEEIEIIYNQPI